MSIKIIKTLSPNHIIIITRKTAKVEQSTVHVFLTESNRAATDILIAQSKDAHVNRITQSLDINDGEYHNKIHEIADVALKENGATVKYSSESHCHIRIKTNGGAGFVASTLLQHNVIDKQAATDLLYKLVTTKLEADDAAGRLAQKDSSATEKRKLTILIAGAGRTKEAGFFDNFDS